ncbi:MAG: B12-binding domain-containing radical SAM protein, partial [Flavobacterium sp.]|nr:B12-binding domain-containing radical SAM protein [Flavobacterium sp.]
MNKNPKILFIVHDVYQEDNVFPLGPAYLAAVLKKEGVDVKICCQDIFHYSNEELAKFFLKNASYDLIGIGFLAARFRETVLDLCATVNKFKKNAWLVLGGHGPSPIPEYVLKETNADIVAIGEAEETIIELLKCKLNNGDLSQIKGIAYRDKDDIVVNERREPVRDLDSIPFPEWSLFPMERYTACLELFDMDKEDKALGILTSRGCVNRCNFCYRPERGIRFRSLENVIEEIKILKERYGVTYFGMQDELFVFSKKRIFDFYEQLRKNNLKIKFNCNARVDIFDEEVAICLKESGCKFLSFGMESSDQNVLDLMKKNATVEQNIQAAEITKKIGIGLGLYFIWGNKGDTEETLRNNVKLIKEYNTYDEIRTIRPVTPYPGSELYYETIERGLLSGPEDFFNKFKNSDLFTVNFTNIPLDKCYNLLFDANKDLIIDHYMHTTKDMDAANNLIK